LFPAKSNRAHARRQGWPLVLHTEAGLQSAEYDLTGWSVFAVSNSGRTAEVIRLYQMLQGDRCQRLYSLTAFPDTRLASLAERSFVLGCGPESAVAATKSVVEQALFFRALLEHAAGAPALGGRLADLATQFRAALETSIDSQVVDRIASARNVYWAGRDDGVAEELTLKTNEITRKSADFLEGTYAVHGIEEVMTSDDVLVWIDPFVDAEEKFESVLVEGVGLTIVAIAGRPTRFPTIQIPDAGDLSAYLQLAAGWNLLVETGLRLGVDLDKPARARKVGNEFTG
jgi:glucosamine--fructose-6-phosphate aminotransferase (isomerizing)